MDIDCTCNFSGLSLRKHQKGYLVLLNRIMFLPGTGYKITSERKYQAREKELQNLSSMKPLSR